MQGSTIVTRRREQTQLARATFARVARVTRLLDLGPQARVAFAACWIAGQSALVLTAGGRPDGSFGFRMFPEASTLEIHLQRRVGDRLVPAPGGEWSARDASGQLRHFSWRDRVRDPVLSGLDERRFASYGADAQLDRLTRALDDVSDHIPEDAETARIEAVVRVWRNGRGPETVTLRGHPRSVP
jgi:hypothetical protein